LADIWILAFYCALAGMVNCGNRRNGGKYYYKQTDLKMNPPLTDLDLKLIEMATKNWPQFVSLIGEDAITAAKICLLRQDKKSYGQIQTRLGLTKNQVEYGCTKCDDKLEC
jgi:hypothetical protein